MKTIREFLEEQINEQLIQAVVSGRRTGEGPSKVKLRPVELKGQIFYQASMTEVSLSARKGKQPSKQNNTGLHRMRR